MLALIPKRLFSSFERRRRLNVLLHFKLHQILNCPLCPDLSVLNPKEIENSLQQPKFRSGCSLRIAPPSQIPGRIPRTSITPPATSPCPTHSFRAEEERESLSVSKGLLSLPFGCAVDGCSVGCDGPQCDSLHPAKPCRLGAYFALSSRVIIKKRAPTEPLIALTSKNRPQEPPRFAVSCSTGLALTNCLVRSLLLSPPMAFFRKSFLLR